MAPARESNRQKKRDEGLNEDFLRSRELPIFANGIFVADPYVTTGTF